MQGASNPEAESVHVIYIIYNNIINKKENINDYWSLIWALAVIKLNI